MKLRTVYDTNTESLLLKQLFSKRKGEALHVFSVIDHRGAEWWLVVNTSASFYEFFFMFA
jgi:hypothetical protein